jgi:hypothetical protein
VQGRASGSMSLMSALKSRIIVRIATLLPVVAFLMAHTNSGPVYKG